MATKYKSPKRPSFENVKRRQNRAIARQTERDGRSDQEQFKILSTQRPGNSTKEKTKLCKRTAGDCFCGFHTPGE